MGFRLTLALLALSMLVSADEADDALRRFREVLPRTAVTFVWRNLSNMPPEDAERIRRALDRNGETGPELRVTLSENPKSYLLVSQPQEGPIEMVSWPKPPVRIEKPPHQLSRTVVWEQPSPILDAVVQGDRIFVLEPMRVSGKDVRPVGLSLPRPMPRDPRGRIFDAGPGENFRILLPGVRCSGPLQKLACSTAREPWIVAARNYFEGARGRYYTLAELDGVTLQAETDGRTRVYAGPSGDAVLKVIEGWSSEIAPLGSACGSHVLAALESGQLQAFRYAAGQLYPSTPPFTLEGPVTAMWPSADKDQVTVIVHNRTTGNYEASRVSIHCAGNK